MRDRLRALASAAGGHLWTIATDLVARARPVSLPPDQPWEITVPDERYGSVRLGGRMRDTGGDTLVVVVHGLGGNRNSPYVHKAARAIDARGWSCLRVDLRGADGLGEDFYHAGLTGDLHAIVAACPRFARVYVLGYSLGGHMTLRFATEAIDPRVAAVAAVCSPLDLAAVAAAFDRTRTWIYRVHVLRGLRRAHAELARRRSDPTDTRRIRTIREWDERIVAPRHGFVSADDYYARTSAGPRLPHLVVPAAWFGTRWDPMVPASTVLPSLTSAGDKLQVHWFDRGGHVGYPADIANGRTLEDAVLDFFTSQNARTR
jgi:hypothetical protein